MLTGSGCCKPMQPAIPGPICLTPSPSICLSTHPPFLYLSIHLFLYPSLDCLSVHPLVRPSISTSIDASIHPSIHYLSFDYLSVHPSMCPLINVHPSIRFYVIHQFVAPSIPLPIRLPITHVVAHTSLHSFNTSSRCAHSPAQPCTRKTLGTQQEQTRQPLPSMRSRPNDVDGLESGS